MKAVKYLALVAVALAMPLTFTSCDDDDDVYDPEALAGTAWKVVYDSCSEYSFEGATFFFSADGTGYIDGLSLGWWNYRSANFSYSEGDDGVTYSLYITFDGNDTIEGIISFQNEGYTDGAVFNYSWTSGDNAGIMYSMHWQCIAE